MIQDRFTFTTRQRLQVSSLLKRIIKKRIDQGGAFTQSIAQINIFTKLTELDVNDLRDAGRYQLHPNWLAAQLAERFSTLLGIELRRTSKDFLQLLSICLESAGTTEPNTNVYRYAANGIKAVSGSDRDVYKLLTPAELRTAKAMDGNSSRKKRILTESRKKKKTTTL
ncbi:hypothetical protein [Methylotenera sp.]|uniref:hypothetical protein n=1 Tax=Methylotenera sp. TaxID=2051956 RepID=UPI00271CB284|nr:hypothetical protein [Methylotenera sp.]MDO9206514.1 hypothetical protein [Methylotenera sp.]